MENENRTLIIVLIVVLVLILIGNLGYGMGGLYGGFMFLGWILNIIVIILIVLGIYWLIKHINFDDGNININVRRSGKK